MVETECVTVTEQDCRTASEQLCQTVQEMEVRSLKLGGLLGSQDTKQQSAQHLILSWVPLAFKLQLKA